MQNQSFAQGFLFKGIDYLSRLHFMFKGKDSAPGGTCIYNLTLSTACLKSSLF